MKLRLAALVLAGATAFTTLACGSSAPNARAATPSCAWTQATNAYWPDLGATYWTTTAQPNTKITVSGQPPAVRYFSLMTYTWYGSTLGHIADTQIPRQANGSFTVTVGPTGANLQSPYFTDGYLMLRTYLPGQKVNLPSVKINGVAIPNCNDGTVASPTIGVPSTATTTSTWTETQPATTGGVAFPNPDNHFLSATIANPGANNVMVLKARAPKVPAELRYWSACSYNSSTTEVVDCRNDTNIPVGPDGFYRLVMGTTAQRPAVEAAGGTFLRYSSLVDLRNLLGGTTLSGDYIPTVTPCPVTNVASCIS